MEQLLVVDFEDPGYDRIVHALSGSTRKRIIDILSSETLNVNRIAERLALPQSTVATNLRILEKAGLLEVRHLSSGKGTSQKLCSLSFRNIVIQLPSIQEIEDAKAIEVEMPLGLYVDYDAGSPCGLCSTDKIIGFLDVPKSFLNPDRSKAALIWFTRGYLEYKFPNNLPPNSSVKRLELSMEVCSEALDKEKEWPSDITVWVNGIEIGTWTSPSDYTGIRGKSTPSWWRINASQYGLLKRWSVSPEGAYVDGEKASAVLVSDLDLTSHHSIKVRIGIKNDAEHVGGVNIFGKGFGNYDQDLILRLEVD